MTSQQGLSISVVIGNLNFTRKYLDLMAAPTNARTLRKGGTEQAIKIDITISSGNLGELCGPLKGGARIFRAVEFETPVSAD
jgi:hypothetical protein